MTIRENLRAFATVWDIPIILIAALGFFFVAAYELVDRQRILPVSRERIVEMKSFLDRQVAEGRKGDVYFLGSSVTVEGIDCDVINPLLPAGRHSFNLAWTGAGPREWLLALPSIQATQPSLVVMCSDVDTVLKSTPIPEDLLAIANWWNLVPAAALQDYRSFLSASEIRRLDSPKYKDLFTFRTFPPNTFDAYVREVSRKDLRYDRYARNFTAPWVQTRAVSPSALQRGLNIRERELQSAASMKHDEAIRVFGGALRYLRSRGCPVLIVRTPINPTLSELKKSKILDRAGESMKELAVQNDAGFVDHSTLLSAEQYTDHVHPLGSGRLVWSQALAAAVLDYLNSSK